MKAFELTKAIEQLFDCRMGEPRSWTRNPPDFVTFGDIPDEDKNWYAVFGYSGTDCTEERLVDALYADFKAMHFLCTQPRPTLLWRRKPEYREGIANGQRYRMIAARLVIPEIAHGSLRTEWLKVRSHKPDCESYRSPKG